METVSDEDLYIGNFFIACPGSNEDLNVVRQPPLFQDFMSGACLPDRLSTY